jgi:hypothetical protein
MGRNEGGYKGKDSCALVLVLLLAGLSAFVYGASHVVGALIG